MLARSADAEGSSSASIDEDAVWMEASGGVLNGQIYGKGSESREYVKKFGTSSSSSKAARRPPSDPVVTKELTQLKAQLA